MSLVEEMAMNQVSKKVKYLVSEQGWCLVSLLASDLAGAKALSQDSRMARYLAAGKAVLRVSNLAKCLAGATANSLAEKRAT